MQSFMPVILSPQSRDQNDKNKKFKSVFISAIRG